MSSHREAPEISKDPVADSTDLYAFVSPDAPDTVTLIANYVPLQSPAGRPELLRVRRRRALRDPHRQRRRRQRRHHVPVPVHDRLAGRRHVPLQRRADHVARQRQLEPAAVLHGDADRLGRASDGTGTTTDARSASRSSRRRAVPAVQHRPALDAELRRARQRGDPRPSPAAARCSPGQRAEGFYVDLGSVFDLGDLRPFQQLHTQFGLSVPELTRPRRA